MLIHFKQQETHKVVTSERANSLSRTDASEVLRPFSAPTPYLPYLQHDCQTKSFHE